MAELIELRTITDPRGNLTVIEHDVGFKIKRVFYIYDVPPEISRGGHRHIKNKQVLICVHGNCKVLVKKGSNTETYLLDSPMRGLRLHPQDWHEMLDFSNDAVLLVLASELYYRSDYIDEVQS